MNKKELIRIASEARDNAYAPYSNFHVGAAVLFEDGRVFSGCNIESSSYGATCCAERVAIQKGVSEGLRKIKMIAIVGPESITYPCGICRQVIAEFCDDCKIVIAYGDEDREYTMNEILPFAFTKKDLNHV